MKRKDKQSDLDFEVYSKLFMAKIPLAKIVNKYTLNGRCIICNDSKKNLKKTRLYLLRERKSIPNIVVCHNCHYSRSAKVFFEEYFKDEMEELNKSWSDRSLSELKELTNKNREDNSEEELATEDEKLLSHEEEVSKAKEKIGYFFDKYTIPAYMDKDAYGYLLGRMIPDGFLNSCRLLHPGYHDQNIFRYAYLKNYILIPFIDMEDNKYYFFHARKYLRMEAFSLPRYLSCPYTPDDINVSFFFNELGVTTDEPVIINEGTISSMNLPNAISTNGIGKQTDEFIKTMEWRFGGKENIIYANDNELVDRDAMEKSEELLNKGKRVFLWSLFAKDYPQISKLKDFNDLCVASKRKQIPLSIIEKYTVDNPISLLKVKTNVC